jgi:hypothetical protein
MTARKPRKPAVAAPTDTASLYLRLSRESTEEGTGLTTQEADLDAGRCYFEEDRPPQEPGTLSAETIEAFVEACRP